MMANMKQGTPAGDDEEDDYEEEENEDEEEEEHDDCEEREEYQVHEDIFINPNFCSSRPDSYERPIFWVSNDFYTETTFSPSTPNPLDPENDLERLSEEEKEAKIQRQNKTDPDQLRNL